MLIIRGGLRMKNRIYSYIIVLLLVFLTIYVKGRFFYGEDKQKREPSKIEEAKYTNNKKEIEVLMGKWRFTKRISYPRAYSLKAEKLCDNNYIGRIIEIKKDLFDGKTFEIKNPYYKIISIKNPYELMSGYGYSRNKELAKYIQKGDYDVLEILKSKPQSKNNNIYKDFEDEYYQKKDIWTLLVIDNETIIFYENGCFEAKKIK